MWRTPSISTVSCVNCPAVKPAQFPFGRIVSVTLSGVPWRTSTTRPRTSVEDHVGATSSR